MENMGIFSKKRKSNRKKSPTLYRVKPLLFNILDKNINYNNINSNTQKYLLHKKTNTVSNKNNQSNQNKNNQNNQNKNYSLHTQKKRNNILYQNNLNNNNQSIKNNQNQYNSHFTSIINTIQKRNNHLKFVSIPPCVNKKISKNKNFNNDGENKSNPLFNRYNYEPFIADKEEFEKQKLEHEKKKNNNKFNEITHKKINNNFTINKGNNKEGNNNNSINNNKISNDHKENNLNQNSDCFLCEMEPGNDENEFNRRYSNIVNIGKINSGNMDSNVLFNKMSESWKTYIEEPFKKCGIPCKTIKKTDFKTHYDPNNFFKKPHEIMPLLQLRNDILNMDMIQNNLRLQFQIKNQTTGICSVDKYNITLWLKVAKQKMDTLKEFSRIKEKTIDSNNLISSFQPTYNLHDSNFIQSSMSPRKINNNNKRKNERIFNDPYHSKRTAKKFAKSYYDFNI